MATDFIMPRLPDQQQHPGLFQPQQQQWAQLQQQHPIQPIYTAPSHHQRQQSNNSNTRISPLSTSGSGSPTSPKTYHTRQIRPLYMPAVLRPNEFRSKAPRSSPPTDDEVDEDKPLKSNSSFISLGSALTRLSRRSTGDSGKDVSETWNLDMFPQPTGMPTREHWKSDNQSTVCDHSTCRKTFSYFTRRHHCRRCGNIFCDDHSAYEIPLDQNANYNPRGTPVRACAHCHSQFKEWRSRTNSQDSSTSSSGSDQETGGAAAENSREIPSSPLSTSPNGAPKARAEVALSVPRDWNWSTF